MATTNDDAPKVPYQDGIRPPYANDCEEPEDRRSWPNAEPESEPDKKPSKKSGDK